jgi:hypothetical protein
MTKSANPRQFQALRPVQTNMNRLRAKIMEQDCRGAF